MKRTMWTRRCACCRRPFEPFFGVDGPRTLCAGCHEFAQLAEVANSHGPVTRSQARAVRGRVRR